MFAKARLLPYFFCLLLQTAASQLTFKSLPVDLQMIPRGKDNKGYFTVSGSCANPNIASVRVSLIFHESRASVSDKIIALNDNKTFETELEIPSALADYDLEIFSIDKSNVQVFEKKVKELVAGDFLIITGQSNATGALAIDNGTREDSLYGNKYCRTIGSMFQEAISINANTGKPNFDLEKDCRFLRASSIYMASDTIGCVGIVAMRLLHSIVKTTGIPVCIINGAIGATELSYHFATHTPSDPLNLKDKQDSGSVDLPSTYDRMFKKLWSYNATTGLKAIVWYQGESDAALSKKEAETYNERFGLLYKSWKLDYPNLEKIFVFQINTGCGGDYTGIIREQQRKLPQAFENIVLMSTVGTHEEDRAADGCHYTDKGYRKLGEELSPVVLKYLYQVNFDDNYILGPNIQKAYYSRSNEICLEFDKEITVEQFRTFPNGTAFLKEYFYYENDSNLKLNSVTPSGKKLYMELTDSLLEIKKLTYLPNIFSRLPTLYTGPWILNKNNTDLGAFSFYGFPVEPYPESFWSTHADSLIAYPNPASDNLMVRSRKAEVPKKISFHDVYGKKIFEMVVNEKEKAIPVDVRYFENGIYFLSAYFSDGVRVKKIIIRH